jgi:hypothetical protein
MGVTNKKPLPARDEHDANNQLEKIADHHYQ